MGLVVRGEFFCIVKNTVLMCKHGRETTWFCSKDPLLWGGNLVTSLIRIVQYSS